MAQYKRILLKLSGEGSHRFGSIVAHNPQSLKVAVGPMQTILMIIF